MKNQTKQVPVLYWMRQDFRLSDNPALCWAAAQGAVLPVIILEEGAPASQFGGAGAWWVHQSLVNLQKKIPLLLRHGKADEVLEYLISQTGAKTLAFNSLSSPEAMRRDANLCKKLEKQGIKIFVGDDAYLVPPVQVLTGAGTPYRVFTPFAKSVRRFYIPTPLKAPKVQWASYDGKGENLSDWNLLQKNPDWTESFSTFWKVGEVEAQDRLYDFLDESVRNYPIDRDRPSVDGTSRLSPYLAWGQISARQIWHAALHAQEAEPEKAESINRFMSEILWREFARHLLFHFSDLMQKPLIERFANFPWKNDQSALLAWQKGQTGYPFVDAGMRQLWLTGWMHNRVRMVVGSFLVKHLLIPWQQGQKWFADTLVDADLANNAASWQWIAGCGADAAPFYRIFNPTLQGQRFDPDGTYIKEYIPELRDFPTVFIHEPWKAPEDLFNSSGYVKPMIDHSFARNRAMAAFKGSWD